MPFPVTPSNTPSVTPTKSVTPSLTPTETPTGTVCPVSPTASATLTPTPTITPTITPTVSIGACRSYTASKLSTFLTISNIDWTDCYGIPQSQTLENPSVTYPESITFCALAGSLVYLNTEISVVDNGPCVPVTQTITPTITQTNTPSNTPTLTPTNTNTPTPSGTAYTPEYQTILNYATSAGFTLPSSTGQTRQNQFIIDLKNAGLWTKYDIFYVFATDGDSNFARLNWKNPAVYSAQTSGGTSITFTSKQGFNASVGSGTYLNTQWTPSTQATAFTQNDASIVYYDFDNNTGTTAVGYCGYVEPLGGSSNIAMNGANVNTQRLNTLTNLPSFYDFRGIGTKIMDRTSSGSTTYYNNTSTGTTYAGLTSTALAAFTLDILRYGSGAANYSSNKCSIFGAGGSISGSTSSLLNAINSYMTGL